MMIDKETRARELINEYSKSCGLRVPVEFHFVDDVDAAWWDWADYNTIRSTADLYEDLSQAYGLCTPFDGNAYHLFIKNDCISFDGTVYHEYTHAIDFERFRIEMNDGNIAIETNPYYEPFLFFTEFNATIYEYIIAIIRVKEEERLDLFYNQKPKIIEYINKLKKHKTLIYNSFYYELSHLMAEIKVWQLMHCDIEECIIVEFQPMYDTLTRLFENWSKDNFELLKNEKENLVEALSEV